MKLLLALLLSGVAALAADPMQPPNRAALTITSDMVNFALDQGVVIYTNNVRVYDPPPKPGEPATTLTCGWLIARRGTNGELESIIAHEKVAIDSGDRLARAAMAVYAASNEVMTLTGAYDSNSVPALPMLAVMSVTNYGTAIVYNRTNNMLSISSVTTIIPQSVIASNNTNGGMSPFRTFKPAPSKPKDASR
jgi:lipopolysaccharide export system protein LptA